MADPLRIKVYLSDEGYGHIVRQRAVIEALRRQHENLEITIQTHRHLEVVKRLIPDVNTVDRYNNITWNKQESGSPDIPAIREQFRDYLDAATRWIARETAEFDYDAVISDFVYEGFEVASRMGVPSFGVSHFTWDWFFCKLYPPPVPGAVINRFFSCAHQARHLFFPPFTPQEILDFYPNVVEVPLILKEKIDHKHVAPTEDFKVMIVDSGAGVLAESVKKALQSLAGVQGFRFYLNDRFECAHPNVELIPRDELLVDYFGDMDLVIGRAGFNTISECIGLRTPMLLIGEAANPEMNENILNLKKEHLGTFISMDTFENELHHFLPDFLEHEYNYIRSRMDQHRLKTNGADVIASRILESLNS